MIDYLKYNKNNSESLGIVNIYDQKRNKNILELYLEGNTCAQLGILFGISRARAHQLIIKQMEREIVEKLKLDICRLSDEEIKLLKLAAKEEIRVIYLSRNISRLKNKKEFIEEKARQLPDCSSFRNVDQYAKALGVSTVVFSELLPETYKKIKNKIAHRWSVYYERCRACGTTSIKYRSNGLCVKCYYKSEDFKDICRDSRMRNGEKWKTKQR
jgi:rubrerythrin